QSITCEEYKPSRRKIAPRWPRSAPSYSARIASLYSCVNVRRFGRSARGPMPPSSTEARSAIVIVIMLNQSRPVQREGNHRPVSHDPDAQGPAIPPTTHIRVAIVDSGMGTLVVRRPKGGWRDFARSYR